MRVHKITEYLRSSVVGASTARLQKMTISHDITQSKVSNLNIAPRVQQQILRLEVSMDNHIAMAILHTRYYLLEVKHSKLREGATRTTVVVWVRDRQTKPAGKSYEPPPLVTCLSQQCNQRAPRT